MNNYNKNDNEGGLKIKVKKRNFNFKVSNYIMFICIIIISIMSGAIAAEYILDSYSVAVDSETDNEYIDRNLIEDYSILAKKVSTSIVTISDSESKLKVNEYSEGNVTGTIVDSKGYIITNYSKIKNLDKIIVGSNTINSDINEATLLGFDENYDIALLKINADNLVPIEFAEKDSYIEGNYILVLGNAICDNYIGSLIPGTITSLNDKHNLIETDAIINDDNTGGVICNMNGKLVGIGNKEMSVKYNKQGLYYGVSAEKITDIISNIEESNNILGIIGVDAKESEADGIYVKEVDSSGVASESGVLAMDIIREIDEIPVEDNNDIFQILKDKPEGSKFYINLIRNGRPLTITATK